MALRHIEVIPTALSFDVWNAPAGGRYDHVFMSWAEFEELIKIATQQHDYIIAKRSDEIWHRILCEPF